MAPWPYANPQDSPSRPSEINNPNNDNNDNDHDNHSSVWGWILLGILLALVVAGAAWIMYARMRARRLGLPPPRMNPFSDSHRVLGSDDNATYPSGNTRGGFVGWVQDKWGTLRNKRTAGGAYEGTNLAGGGPVHSGTRGGRRRFGGLDPDEAWDARVGHEGDAYYEEQELGLHEPVTSGPDGAYGGSGYGRRPGVGGRGYSGIETGVISATDDDNERGRRRSRSGAGVGGPNPFGDHAATDTEEISLRGVSPRPHIDTDQDTSYRSQIPSQSGPSSSSQTQQQQHARGGKGSKGSLTNESPTERRSLFREEM